MTYPLLGYLACFVCLLGLWGWAIWEVWRDIMCGCLGSYGVSWLRMGIVVLSLVALHYLVVMGPM